MTDIFCDGGSSPKNERSILAFDVVGIGVCRLGWAGAYTGRHRLGTLPRMCLSGLGGEVQSFLGLTD